MVPVKFNESNMVFAENQPEYQPLPAFKDMEGNVVTCWQMTWRERIRLMITGRVFLIVSTFNNPLQPINMSIHSPIVKA